MKYKLIKNGELAKKEKFGVNFSVYPNIGDCGIVLETTEKGHNQEFFNKESTFTYIVLNGNGSFFLDDEEVSVSEGDCISIIPNTRIYFRGKLKMLLITNPAWKPEDEIETRGKIW
jgi:mannose-6-phosphate isomerase-like protein (cupin superfamily)